MRSDIIGWDAYELHDIQLRIRKELTNLQSEKDYPDSFIRNMQSSWQTPVGQIYNINLQNGLKLLEPIINSLKTSERHGCHLPLLLQMRRRH